MLAIGKTSSSPSIPHHALTRPRSLENPFMPFPRCLTSFNRHLAPAFRFLPTALIVSALFLLPHRSPAQIIDTATPWLAKEFTHFQGLWGEPAFGSWGAWGQTFTAPSGFSRLESFSVWVQTAGEHYGHFDDAKFVTQLYEWNTTGETLVGPALYTSGPQLVPFQFPPDAAQALTFNLGGLKLNPSKTYMFFLTGYDFFDDAAGELWLGEPGDAYAGGAQYHSNSSAYADLFAERWAQPDPTPSDIAFVARFSAVPEPSTYALFGTLSLASAAMVRHLRRRRVPADAPRG